MRGDLQFLGRTNSNRNVNKGYDLAKQPEQTPPAVPRNVPEGQVPLLAVEGTAYECGCRYVQAVHREFPGYRRYLDRLHCWVGLPSPVIATHANHPEGDKTAPFEAYPDSTEHELSRHRMHRLYSLLDAERGRLMAQKAWMALADHAHYPGGICRHIVCSDGNRYTSAAVVAEPAKGMLHIVRGTPCANWPVTYSL